jgi:thiamine-phosphate pyrophosphorylase
VTRALPRLHAVTNHHIIALPDLADRATSIARAGTVALHARAGAVDAARVIELARVLGRAGATLFVNDRVDLVREVGAVGVHLPAAGLSVAAARQLLGPDAIVGRSTHSPEEAWTAHAEGADYVFLGPIWETASHPGRPALGPDSIAAADPATVIAIGGITPGRAALCRDAGAYGVAAISALWLADDPGSAASEMLLCFSQQ